MSSDYYHSLLVFFVFIPLLAGIRLSEGSWFTPASIFASIWFLVIAVSLVSATSYYFSPQAIGFLIAMAALFFAGGKMVRTAGDADPDVKAIVQRNSILTRDFFSRFIYFSFISGIAAIFFLLKDSSIQLQDFSKDKFLQIAEQFTRERYSGIRLSQFTMFFLMINYSGCMVAGWMTAVSKEKLKKAISLSVFIPILIFTFLYTARAILLYGLVLFTGSFFASRLQKGSGSGAAKNKNMLLAILSGMFLIPVIFILTQAFRMGIEKFSFNNVVRLADYLKVWFAGNISAFSISFDHWLSTAHANGKFTFGGLFELLNLGKREVGIYTVSYDVDGKMTFTNIYTLFRFLIDDFGFAGACLFILALGFISKKLYINARHGSLTSTSLLGGIISLLLFSFIASVWAYNTVLFAWFIVVFCCFFLEKKYDHAG